MSSNINVSKSTLAIGIAAASLTVALHYHIKPSIVENTTLKTVYVADIQASNMEVVLSSEDQEKVSKLLGDKVIISIRDTPYEIYEVIYLEKDDVKIRYVNHDFKYSLIGDLFNAEGKNLSKHTKAYQEAQRTYKDILSGKRELPVAESVYTPPPAVATAPILRVPSPHPSYQHPAKPTSKPSKVFNQTSADSITQRINDNLKNTVIPEMMKGDSFEQKAAFLLSEQFNNPSSINTVESLRKEVAKLEAKNPSFAQGTPSSNHNYQQNSQSPQLPAQTNQKVMSKIGYDKTGNKLSEADKITQVKALTKALPMEYTVNYPAEGEEKLQLFIFSDPTCPYCTRFHHDIPKFQKAGITVRYLYYPRSGVKGTNYKAQKLVERMTDTWCSSNPAQAVDMMYDGLPVAEGRCDEIPEERKKMGNVVYQHYILGRFFNLRYTPSFFTNTGHTFFSEGYSNFNSFMFKLKFLK